MYSTVVAAIASNNIKYNNGHLHIYTQWQKHIVAAALHSHSSILYYSSGNIY